VRSVPLPASLPRVVAGVVAGSAIAAAGQVALTDALHAVDGAAVLRVGLQDVVDVAPQSPAPPLVAPVSPSVLPVSAEPVVADAAALVKAADLNLAAAAEAERAAEAAAVAETDQAAPVGGDVLLLDGRVTSGFGARWGRQHAGLDIAAPIGTPIRVPFDGVVIDSGAASGFGLWVRVRHEDGTVTVYGHINRALVAEGDRVSAGEVIAEVGNRGRSTGPHLHFEVVRPDGTKIDPRRWLDDRGVVY
jgi:murein DD-endopeptidase MepM/ murein hydrolase activator NlpD